MKARVVAGAVAAVAVCSRAAAEPQAPPVHAGSPVDCAKSVVVTGPPALTLEVTERLRARGFDVPPKEGCNGLDVRLDRRAASVDGGGDDGLDVVLEGGRATRAVSDAATAASVIEAWSDSSLVDPLVLPPRRSTASERVSPRGDGAATTSDSKPANALTPDAVTPDAATALPRFVIGARLGLAYGADDSLWTSVIVSACGRAGPLCVGFQIRGSFDPGVSGASANTSATRGGIDALATLDLPVALGPVTLRPGLGAGFEWVRVARSSTAQGVGDRDDEGLRLEGSVRLEVPFSDRVAFTVGGAFDASPLARWSATIDAEPQVPLPVGPLWQIGGALGLAVRFDDPAPKAEPVH